MTSPAPSGRPPKIAATPKVPQPPLSGSALLAGLLCLCLGGMYLWRQAGNYRAAQREQATLAAAACGGAVEASLTRPFVVLDTLAGLVRQSGGRLVGFANLAAEILPPGADSLDLAPNGTISDVVPRAGRERMIGYNALREPVTAVAVQVRKLGVAGPFALPGGGAGLVGRLPVFLKDAQGKEFFWGLVSATVSLPRALPAANFDRLAAQGYNYALLVPAPKPYPLASRGLVDPATAVVHRVQVANVDFLLAVSPAQGWGHGSRALPAWFILLGLSFLVGWSMQTLAHNAWYKARLLESAKQTELEANHAITAEEGLHAAVAASEEEARSAKEATEALRAQLRVAETATRRAQERCVQLEEEMQMAKDTGAAMLSSARKMAESLQTGLREAQVQARETQEERDKLRQELQQLRERASHEDVDAQRRRESLQSLLVETQVELQHNREQLSLMEAELKSASTKAQQAEMSQVELMHEFELQKASAFRNRIEPEAAAPSLSEAAEIPALIKPDNGPSGEPVETPPEEITHSEPAHETAVTPAESPTTQGDLLLDATSAPEAHLPEVPAVPVLPEPGLMAANEPVPLADVSKAPEMTLPELDAPPIETELNQPVAEAIEPQPEAVPPSAAVPEVPDSPVETDAFEWPEPPAELAVEESHAVETPEVPQPVMPAEAAAPEEVAPVSPEVPPAKPAEPEPAKDALVATQESLDLGSLAKPEKPPRRKKAEESAQLSLFEAPLPTKAAATPRAKESSREAKAKAAPLPAFDRATFKRSATELSMLLMESDPGAQECLEDYQVELKPAFTPDAYAEFAQRVRESDFHEALALLGKAARKHGVTLRHE